MTNGMNVVQSIEAVGSTSGKASQPVVIMVCVLSIACSRPVQSFVYLFIVKSVNPLLCESDDFATSVLVACCTSLLCAAYH